LKLGAQKDLILEQVAQIEKKGQQKVQKILDDHRQIVWHITEGGYLRVNLYTLEDYAVTHFVSKIEVGTYLICRVGPTDDCLPFSEVANMAEANDACEEDTQWNALCIPVDTIRGGIEKWEEAFQSYRKELLEKNIPVQEMKTPTKNNHLDS